MKNGNYQTIISSPLKFVAVIVSILLIGHIIFVKAQGSIKSADTGFKPGNSYAISDIETISVYGGNLMLNVPLGSLPAGRGGLSGGVGLQYNSKLYDMTSVTFEGEGGNENAAYTKNTLINSDEGGWQYGYKYVLKSDWAQGRPCEATQGTQKNQIVTPDGGQHTLIAGNIGLTDNDGYSSILPDGHSACYASTITPGQKIIFFTNDNTFMRLEVIADSDSNWANNAWTLYMPNGMKVEYDPQASYAQRITDRNGNHLDIIETASDSNYSGHKTTTLLDQLQRKVVIEYDGATNEDWIHSKGFNGANIKTRVVWKNISVNRIYNACGDSCNPPVDGLNNEPLNTAFRVVDKIYVPDQISDNLYYAFDYNADTTSASDIGWGELEEVKLPSDAKTNYEYQYDNVSGSLMAENVLTNRPTKKTLTYNLEYDQQTTAAPPEIWTYEVTGSDPSYPTSSKIISPDGSATIEYYDQPSFSVPLPNFYPHEAYKMESPDGTVVEKWYQNNALGAVNNGYATQRSKANRFVKYEFVSIRNAAGNLTQTAIKEYSRDKNGNVTEVREYDFAAYSSVPRNSMGRPYTLPSGIIPARITKTAYYNDTPDSTSTNYNDTDSYHLATSPRLINLAKSAEVQNGSSVPKSHSEIYYDFTDYAGSNAKGGNPVETRSWDSTKQPTLQTADSNGYKLVSSNYVNSLVSYDQYGNPTQTTDAKGVQTTITYGCIDGQTSCSSSPWLENLYPTRIETASNYSSLKRTSTAQYDFYTGLVTTATDVDNNVSTATYYDELGRPEKVAAAVGTSSEIWTQTDYDDENRRVIVKSDVETKGDAKKIAVQHYDQLGRVRLSRQIEDAATQSATNETDGIKVQTRYQTGNPYSYQWTSNPYRAATSNAATNEPSMGWTRSKSLNTGKHSEIETFSGAAFPGTATGSTASTGIVQTDIDGERTLVTDQAGKQRISKTNALGQLVNVWEVTAADSNTEAITFGSSGLNAYKTSYVYDTLNNLTTVNQGSQTRSFSYSSLSRLLSANNPESGTISYSYDNNGNLTQKTDARQVVTGYVYDALNRVTYREYSDSTPQVTYTYDDKTNAKGKLTKVTTGNPSSPLYVTEYQVFDTVGRVTQSQQWFDGTTYGEPMTYTYNLSGAMIEQKYPSGRVVKNVLDNDGDLAIVQSKKNTNSGFFNYAKNFTYTAAGAVTSMQLGNGKWESTQFNSRLQPTQIGLGTVQNGTDKLKLDFEYGTLNTGTGQVIAGTNNGNVAKQTITVPTETRNNVTYGSFSAVQYYTYDALNRIKIASENLTPNGQSTYQSWMQTFQYDRYGNRNFDEANTTTLPKNCGTSPNWTVCPADKKVLNPSISTSNNRIIQDQDGDSQNDYLFDTSGNTTKDAQGRTFIYDAESKQIEVKDSQNQTIGKYFYDGDGKRVKKYVPSTGETTVFVYNAGGQLVAEYSTQISQQPQVSYLTSDHLGSPRINTDASGQVIARHDYQPFGEEITRASYGADSVRKKFTGYERDIETELDFAQARYFNSGYGRFSSPDSFTNDTRVSEPQSWNLYVYVRNNPLAFIDPTGKIIEETNGKVKTKKRKDDSKDHNVEEIDGKFYLKYGYKTIGDKKYYITWEVEKVFVFADDKTPIKALIAKTGIMLVDSEGTVLDEKTSMEMLQKKENTTEIFSNTSNCYGTALAKGQVWIQEETEVKKLMVGDGYDISNAKTAGDVGDVGIFSSSGENIDGMAHAVKVTASSDGKTTEVESKNGIRNTVRTSPSSAWEGPEQVYYFSKKVKQ